MSISAGALDKRITIQQAAEARDALKRVPAEATDTGDKVKAALKLLGKHH